MKAETTKFKLLYLLVINLPHTTAAAIGMKCNHLNWTEISKVCQLKCYLIHFVYSYTISAKPVNVENVAY